MVVNDVMTANPATADATEPVRQIINKLMELDVRHLPIVDDGQLAGIISDRDLRDVLAKAVDENTDLDAREARLDEPVSKLMSSDVVSVDPETSLGDVIDLMVEHRIGAVPVVDPDTSELVGIVSYIDVLKVARNELE
jgi:acetoin utilization protein AcuB